VKPIARPSLVVFFIDKFKLELAYHYGQNAFCHRFCKSFSNTDPFSAKEGAKAHWVPLLSIRSPEIFALRIESFRNILLGGVPFFNIMMQSIKVD